MTTHVVDSTYRQFYVADAGLDPDAPEDWSDTHLQQHFNALKNIVALCTKGDITARVLCCPPGKNYDGKESPDFEARTTVTIETGRLGVFGWPRETLEEFQVEPGVYNITFRGFKLSEVDSEGDYYVVELSRKA